MVLKDLRTYAHADAAHDTNAFQFCLVLVWHKIPVDSFYSSRSVSRSIP